MACPLYGEHYALRLSFLAVTLASFSTLIDSALTKFPFVKWLYYAEVCNELTKSRRKEPQHFLCNTSFRALIICIHQQGVTASASLYITEHLQNRYFTRMRFLLLGINLRGKTKQDTFNVNLVIVCCYLTTCFEPYSFDFSLSLP